jgi:hypothetical protein
LCRWRKESELPEEGENLGMGPLKYDKKLNNLAHASYMEASHIMLILKWSLRQ